MTNNKIHDFIARWTGHGYEKGESQRFWIDLLQSVLEVDNAPEIITFEDQVHLDHTSFIDAYIQDTQVMIEQKSIHKDLRAPIKQSDGSLLTPFQQAKRYASELPRSLHPRWIVTCNFQSFLIYDMEKPQGEPTEIFLADLEKEAYRLQFLVKKVDVILQRELQVSIQAGEIVGKLYDAFLEQYQGEATAEDLHSLNVLCVRLVFCLYAEDAGIFAKDQFSQFLQSYSTENLRRGIIDLFATLDTPIDRRDRFLESKLKAFPYVNGSLFKQKPGEEVPPITDATADLLIRHAALDFDWSAISPTIFGAVFESTLNPETRRTGGMHYTSIENIHKVIDPLFLDDLNGEFDTLAVMPKGKQRTHQLEAFQDKLAGLKFLDPACGSGNFLTETYVSLRRLENRVIEQLVGGQTMMGFEEVNPIKVHIQQFYGIEINDFAATVAKTALWIAEAQMMNETERVIQFTNDYLPLKAYENITEGNALRIDWNDVISANELNYIIGNPPFVGARMMEQNGSQKKDIEELFGKIKDVQDLDYVSGWYKKAAQMIQGTKAKVCFVSTNSISQGSQVPILWSVLFNDYNVKINIAYPTFKWESESTQKAAVHCVIVGFATFDRQRKFIINDNMKKVVKSISPYLFEGDETFVVACKTPICDVPKMNFGNQPRDGGHFVISPEEREEIIQRADGAEKFLHPYIGAEEFIKGKKRWCLWLKGCSPVDIKNSKTLYDKVTAVKEMRLASKAKTTNGYAKVPHLFAQITQPDDADYMIIPRVSSERRRYVPMGFLSSDAKSSDAVQIIPNATLYHFGILTSNVHMAWMRAVCGRLEMRYRYSKEIVYNPFPWPTPTDAQKQRIEQTAQAILDARNLYPDCSLADLYDEVTMPPELRKAHQDNDRAVMAAYGFPVKNFTESDCVAELFKRYKALVEK